MTSRRTKTKVGGGTPIVTATGPSGKLILAEPVQGLVHGPVVEGAQGS